MSNTRDIGALAEERAADFLQRLGYVVVARNWRYKNLGEIDIIARDGDLLVFVEVRYRHSHRYGLPESTVSRAKLRKIRSTATLYMLSKGLHHAPCRIDVIGMDMMDHEPQIRHYKNVVE
jgi:putative endonuclease